jgi:hypothetical protein
MNEETTPENLDLYVSVLPSARELGMPNRSIILNIPLILLSRNAISFKK